MERLVPILAVAQLIPTLFMHFDIQLAKPSAVLQKLC